MVLKTKNKKKTKKIGTNKLQTHVMAFVQLELAILSDITLRPFLVLIDDSLRPPHGLLAVYIEIFTWSIPNTKFFDQRVYRGFFVFEYNSITISRSGLRTGPPRTIIVDPHTFYFRASWFVFLNANYLDKFYEILFSFFETVYSG